MNLQAEHIVAILSIASVFFAAVGYFIRSAAKARVLNAQALLIEAETRQKIALAEAEREKTETETGSEVTRKITDEVIRRGDANANLQSLLRESEVHGKEQDGVIKELRSMNTTLGERNQMQANLLKDAARRIEALEKLNNLQENKIRVYELKFGLLPEDKTP